MDRRLKKQLIYGLVFFGILFVLVAGPILFRSAPAESCFDGIENQNESGIDCGGSCDALCPLGKKIEVIGKINAFYVAPGESSVLAKIRNTDPAVAAKRFRYTFDVYGKGGERIQTLHGQSFIYAQEIKYLLLPGVRAGVDEVERVDFNVTEFELAPSHEFRRPEITVPSFRTEIIQNHVEVTGDVTNQDEVNIPLVQVMAVFRGAFGQVFGASFTQIEDIRVGERRLFTILYPFHEGIDAGATEVIPFASRQ